MWSCFLQGASETQTALESVISGPLFGPSLEPCSSMFAQISCRVVLLTLPFLFPKAINTPPRDHLQGPPEPAKTQRKPQRPTPALPLGRHRRSHIDTVFYLMKRKAGQFHSIKHSTPRPLEPRKTTECCVLSNGSGFEMIPKGHQDGAEMALRWP